MRLLILVICLQISSYRTQVLTGQKLFKRSAEKLLVAADFLASLVEKDDDATEELLKMSGFKEAFTKTQKSITEGKVITE